MSTLPNHYIANAIVDAKGHLTEADEPLSSLQEECGGVMGGPLAIPELRALAMKTQKIGLRLARRFEALGEDERITAWVEIEPLNDAERNPEGCKIGVVNWHSEELGEASETLDLARRAEANRHFAELTARLDEAQNIISVASEATDLRPLHVEMSKGAGRPWTDFVELKGNAHEQPMHWRLLDGSTFRVAGSKRQWTAHLEPLGPQMGQQMGQQAAGQQAGQKSGFALYLVAETALTVHSSGANRQEADELAPALGRDLSPVLRQPINRIIANAETIRTKLAGPLTEEYSGYAADIATAGQHLLALLDDLSDLEVVESDDFVTAPDRIDLADVARQACGILGVRAREKGIELVAPSKGETQLSIAEFRRVLQILINLINNAIRYAPQGSQIWVRLDRIGERALMTVADQGYGLDDEQQAKVFEKFERLGRSGDGGSGLGLYISRRIARAMDGDLTVESAKGQGARFTLSVPAADDLRSKPRDNKSLDDEAAQ
jgi:signal transduction histidine kinase